MSCSPFDIRDYFFGELPEEDRRQVAAHTKACVACREALQQLESTQGALLTLRDEEVPQRIGFVSDRVYEPSVLLRWWRAFWASAPRLGFASAAMLSAAIVFSAVQHQAPPPAAPTVDVARLQADFSRQLNEAVTKAVADSDARHARQTAELLATATRQFHAQSESDREVFAQRLAIMEKYSRLDVRAAILGNGPR
jgi:anti-sigma factor RsiW